MLVLSEKIINEDLLDKTVRLKVINPSSIEQYNNNSDVVAVICSRKTSTIVAKMMLPNLKLLNLTSAGFDGVPLEEYSRRGIPVANAGSSYSVAIAETVVFGMLQMAKRLRQNPNSRRFKITRGYKYITELKDKSAVILGAGDIGTAIAKRLINFEMQIVGYDQYLLEKSPYSKIINTKEKLKLELNAYNYVISTLPDNETTRGFVDASIIKCMNKDCVIVNVGRRTVLNEKDLYSSLKSKTIGGAILDMFEILPNPITNRFRRLSNVIIFPGVAAISKEANQRLDVFLANNINKIAAGDSPMGIINGL